MTTEIQAHAAILQGKDPDDLLNECERFLKTFINTTARYETYAYLHVPGATLVRGQELLRALAKR